MVSSSSRINPTPRKPIENPSKKKWTKQAVLQSKDVTITINIKERNPEEKDPVQIKHAVNDVQEAEDEEDNMPICIIYKKDIKGTTLFSKPENPDTSDQETDMEETTENEIGEDMNVNINDDQQPVLEANEAANDEAQQVNSLADETVDIDTQQGTIRKKYFLRPRKFKARKLEPGEEGESELNPIVVL